jgi:hypothetical protein
MCHLQSQRWRSVFSLPRVLAVPFPHQVPGVAHPDPSTGVFLQVAGQPLMSGQFSVSWLVSASRLGQQAIPARLRNQMGCADLAAPPGLLSKILWSKQHRAASPDRAWKASYEGSVFSVSRPGYSWLQVKPGYGAWTSSPAALDARCGRLAT